MGPSKYLRRLVSNIVEFGTRSYTGDIARRLRIFNGLNAFVAVASFAKALQYAVHDVSLYPVSITATTAGLLLFASPLFHRWNEIIAPVYFCIVVSVDFFVIGMLSGSSAGSQYNLLAAPGIVLVFGSRRLALSLVMALLLFLTFVAIDVGAPVLGQIAPMNAAFGERNKIISITTAAAILFGAMAYALKLAESAEEALSREYQRSEGLLQNLMPGSIAARLKKNPDQIIADHFEDVTILFADIVDFTPRAMRLAPARVVGLLNRVFSEFDRLAEKHKLEKIKTIGDAYMIAGGMPDQSSGHCAAVAEMALDMLDSVTQIGPELDEDLRLRIGIHTGPAIAGVIGTRKLFYDVWGDTVNTASRMESQGSAGRIQVTENTRLVLGSSYKFEFRGVVDVKGKGPMSLYYLEGREPSTV
ncbi:adenylate/guanylate cyclase domain-containing protein [Mesorhizobium sp. CN2-181]|uniref:adenylate/guanylate cyclase domain-containing protein n=1 Tax=Mesorhizobium yinganensis TaxID=3157707 RepID=UPI0032B81611